jgi:hypothetical protein
MMAYSAARRRAYGAVMPGDMACYTSDGRALQAAFCVRKSGRAA